MPETSADLAWYAFNLAMLGMMFFARNDLKEIKIDIKAARAKADKNELEFATHKAACEERHKRLDYEIVGLREKEHGN